MNEIYNLCLTYGPLLSLPSSSGIDGAKFMAAIAWNESSCGKDMTPRHEPAYDFGGLYSDRPPQSELLAHWGKQAAYSYGPWQILPCNARGFTPVELFSDNDKCAQAFVGFFNRYIIGVRHALTLEEMFQTYNSGHFVADPAPGVYQYVVDGLKVYNNLVLFTLNMPPTEVAS